jgi:hypothetical protein
MHYDRTHSDGFNPAHKSALVLPKASGQCSAGVSSTTHQPSGTESAAGDVWISGRPWPMTTSTPLLGQRENGTLRESEATAEGTLVGSSG